MYIEKTILLPTDDLLLADTIMDSYLHEQRKVLLVVLGDDMAARRLVESADRWAGIMTDPRWVIWVRNRSHIATLANDLKDPQHLVSNWDNVLAFSVSLSDNICDVIGYTTAYIKPLTIQKAYLRAEADSAATLPPMVVSRVVVSSSRSITLPPLVATTERSATPISDPVADNSTPPTTELPKKTSTKRNRKKPQ